MAHFIHDKELLHNTVDAFNQHCLHHILRIIVTTSAMSSPVSVTMPMPTSFPGCQTQTSASFDHLARAASSCDHSRALWTIVHGLWSAQEEGQGRPSCALSSLTYNLPTSDSVLPGECAVHSMEVICGLSGDDDDVPAAGGRWHFLSHNVQEACSVQDCLYADFLADNSVCWYWKCPLLALKNIIYSPVWHDHVNIHFFLDHWSIWSYVLHECLFFISRVRNWIQIAMVTMFHLNHWAVVAVFVSCW